MQKAYTGYKEFSLSHYHIYTVETSAVQNKRKQIKSLYD